VSEYFHVVIFTTFSTFWSEDL